MLHFQLKHAIEQANTTCNQLRDDTKECRVAWDIVNDISTAVYANAEKDVGDYCESVPEADECKEYEI
jgi:hypothetical protein